MKILFKSSFLLLPLIMCTLTINVFMSQRLNECETNRLSDQDMRTVKDFLTTQRNVWYLIDRNLWIKLQNGVEITA